MTNYVGNGSWNKPPTQIDCLSLIRLKMLYIYGHPMDVNNPKYLDKVLLCNRPSQTTIRYTWMKAYENLFKVENLKSNSMQTFDSGIASIFDMSTLDATNLSLNFVEVLKDIFKLDYGHLHTPILVFKCEWIKREDNRGNPTYGRDDVGFFMVNFCHMLPLSFEP